MPYSKIPGKNNIFRPEPKKIHQVAGDLDAGFLLIDKPSGEPSFRTVIELRRITGIRQIGFAGILDPLASGLLICGVGKATMLLDWFHTVTKTYEAEARLGSVSDTYDSEGVIQKFSALQPSRASVEAVCDSFRGTIEQIPPMFSAKKYGGKKLYELARKGIEIERPTQEVTIHSLQILSYEYPRLQFRVICSAGTYIRSLINSLGEGLGTGALMSGLRRTAIGPWSVTDAISIRELTSESWRRYRVSVADVQRRMAPVSRV